MLFSTLLVIPALAAVSVSAHGHHDSRHAHLHNNHLQQQQNKRAGSTVLITSGANGLGDGEVHSRLEISDLAANRPEQWALFIQAMGKFQTAASTDVDGYYSIASIHGVPLQDWDGVPQCDSCGGGIGYCPHNSVLFPAWHRAYMALYEQEFIGYALEVANSYPADKKAAMVCAAQSIRFPYWDWAAKADTGSVLPTVISSPQVTYEGPNGEETIANPLYTFSLPDPSAMYYGPFTSWNDTKRWPVSNDADTDSQDSQAVSSFDSIRANMADSIYNLLTTCSDYLAFSNDASGTSACPNSLEGIHNTIHTTSGGPGSSGVSGGHMTYLPLAAFDPIFWLHHANVDRMFALWQTVNPDSYGATQTAPHETWTIASGSVQGPDSPLEPFRKDASTFWTTNEVRDWSSTFKYTYPEFSTSDGSRSAIIAYINELYGSSASLTAGSISEKAEQSSCNNTTTSSTSSVASSTSSTSYSSSSSSAAVTSSVSSSSSAEAAATSSTSVVQKNGATTSSSTVKATVVSSLGPKRSFAPTTKTTVAGSLSTGTPAKSNSTVIGGTTTSNGSDYQYICHLLTPRYALNGSYYVYVFDGQPSSSDSSNYLTAPNLIGAVGVLAGGEMNHNLTTSGAVPLTRYLQGQVQSGALSSMSPNVTASYLAKNLNWKIVKQGQEVNATSLPGFQASVYSALSSPAGKDTLPQWTAPQPVVQATKGKAGGLQSAPESYPNSGSGSNSTVPSIPAYTQVSSPLATATPYSPTSASSTAVASPTSYTGAANKASIGAAAVFAVAGLAALL